MVQAVAAKSLLATHVEHHPVVAKLMLVQPQLAVARSMHAIHVVAHQAADAKSPLAVDATPAVELADDHCVNYSAA